MPHQAGLDPGACCGIEVARELGILHGMTGDVAPDVRPDLVLTSLAEQVADHLAAAEGDDPGELAALLLDLGAEVDLRRKQWLDLAVTGHAEQRAALLRRPRDRPRR